MFEKSVVRLNAVPNLQSWEDLEGDIDRGRDALVAQEQERLRQLELAASGQSCEASVQFTSGSKFNREATQSLSLLPDSASSGQQVSRGGVGRGRTTASGAGTSRGRSGAVPIAAASVSSNVVTPRKAPPKPLEFDSGSTVVGSSNGSIVNQLCRGQSLSARSGAGSVAGGSARKSPAGSTHSAVPIEIEDGDVVQPQRLLVGAPRQEYVLPEALKILLTSTHGKSFPSLQEVLDGYKCKRELNGLEERITMLQRQKRWTDVELLKDSKADVIAAVAWQTDKDILNGSVNELAEGYTRLCDKYHVTLEKLCMFTKRRALELMDQRRYNDWALVTVPFRTTFTDWSPDDPRYSGIRMPPIDPDNVEASTLNRQMFVDSWSDSIINDKYTSLVVDACDEKDEGALAEIRIACHAWLTEWIVVESVCPREWADENMYWNKNEPRSRSLLLHCSKQGIQHSMCWEMRM
jgi:hypothetical protein